jgi:glycosyltransferase involved in cell wall biosynthesis
MTKYILHVIANPIIPLDKIRKTDAYTEKIMKFCRLFKDHHIIFYGQDGCQDLVNYNEYVPILPLNRYDALKKMTHNFTHPRTFMRGVEVPFSDEINKIMTEFGQKLKPEIIKRYHTNDLILHISDAFRISPYYIEINLNMGGYHKCYEHIVYETLQWAKYNIEQDLQDDQILTRGVNTVIYPWFEADQYLFQPEKKKPKTYLYLARLTDLKGINIFLSLATAMYNLDKECQFWIAGGIDEHDPNNPNRIKIDDVWTDLTTWPNTTYFGVVGHEKRNELLSTATVLIQPTRYFEPCGWNAIEAMLCGTPVVAPKLGGFVDTVKDGTTGYLYPADTTYANMIKMINDASLLSPTMCREYAMKNFSPEKAYKNYCIYFDQVLQLYARNIDSESDEESEESS